MKLIDADALMQKLDIKADCKECNAIDHYLCCLRSPDFVNACEAINDAPSIDLVWCQDCKKSHIDGKTTHYLWCVEWGRSTDTFGYCERGEREGE